MSIHSGAWRKFGGGLAVLVAAVAILCWWLGGQIGVDSAVYRGGALALVHGDPLYGTLRFSPTASLGLPFTYPPMAGLLFLPLAALPPQLVWGVFAVLTVLGLVLVLRASVTAPSRVRLVPVLGIGAFLLEPVWRGLGLGQINVALMALVVLDVLVLPRSRYRGVLVGLAAAIKLTPLIFVLHLLVTGRRADAARAVGTFLGLNAISLLVLPQDTLTFWRAQLLGGNNATGASYGRNQTLNGLIQRLTGHPGGAFTIAVLAGLVCLAIALPLARRMHQRGETLGALLVTAFCGLLVSPISWTHHWVWIVPLAGLLVTRAVRNPNLSTILPIVGLAALFTDLCTLVPAGENAEAHWNLTQQLAGNSYVLATLAVGAVLAVREFFWRPSIPSTSDERPNAEVSRANGIPAATLG
ncbi:MAG TPA: glycosyltransferase 87 family protein [Pseudonocardiaceae bacterium]